MSMVNNYSIYVNLSKEFFTYNDYSSGCPIIIKVGDVIHGPFNDYKFQIKVEKKIKKYKLLIFKNKKEHSEIKLKQPSLNYRSIAIFLFHYIEIVEILQGNFGKLSSLRFYNIKKFKNELTDLFKNQEDQLNLIKKYSEFSLLCDQCLNKDLYNIRCKKCKNTYCRECWKEKKIKCCRIKL